LATLAARARAGLAVVSVLHDVTAALAADRVWVLDRGRLVADGAPHSGELRARREPIRPAQARSA
ncbi:MAG: hypothetical protein IT502_18480, partial [Rubrivivax sp.]|nr:hypothetical protein [Rubrivivax sp.]